MWSLAQVKNFKRIPIIKAGISWQNHLIRKELSAGFTMFRHSSPSFGVACDCKTGSHRSMPNKIFAVCIVMSLTAIRTYLVSHTKSFKTPAGGMSCDDKWRLIFESIVLDVWARLVRLDNSKTTSYTHSITFEFRKWYVAPLSDASSEADSSVPVKAKSKKMVR